MRILFYGRLSEAIAPKLDVEAPTGCSIADLRDRLAKEHPGAAACLGGHRVLACVDGAMVGDHYVVADGDEVEFLPPVSGG